MVGSGKRKEKSYKRG